MSELLPCPFCGSGWLYETRRNGYCDDTPVMFCNSCKAVVTWEQVEEEGVNDETKAFVREHWNTRTERVGERKTFNKTGDFATHDSRAERTCENESDSGFLCSACGFGDFDGFHGYRPNYCPNCGARVKK